MKVSPGMAMLFYTAVNKSGLTIDEEAAARIFAQTTYRSIQGYITLNRNNAVCSSTGLAPQELAHSVHIGHLKFNMSEGFAPVVREFYNTALNSQIMLALRTTLAQSGLDAFYDNAVGIGFAIAIANALWKEAQNAGGRAKFTPAHFAAWKLWTSPQMLQILAMDCADALRRELRERIANSTTPLAGLAGDPSVVNLPSAIRSTVSQLILAAFTGKDVATIAGNDFTIVAAKPKIVAYPRAIAPAAQTQAPAVSTAQVTQAPAESKPAPAPAPTQVSPQPAASIARTAVPQLTTCDAIFPRRVAAPHLVNSASDRLAPFASSSLLLSQSRRIR